MTYSGNPLMPESLTAFSGKLFHYTSADGLHGSLTKQHLWASAASSLNDLGEVRQGWELIKEILASEPTSDVVELLTSFADDPHKKQHEVFVLSASIDGDDAAQWRLYANGARGYVIGLNGAAALAVVSPVADSTSEQAKPKFGWLVKDAASVGPWQKVLYQRSDVEAVLRELVAAADAEARQIEGTSGMSEDEKTSRYESVQDWGYEALATIAHLIKSPGFAGENEVRVVVTFPWGAEHIRYRSSSDGIVAYVVLAESPHGPRHTVLRPEPGSKEAVTTLPVASVRLGPLLRPEQAKTVTSFLHSLKLKNVDVLTSDVPLR